MKGASMPSLPTVLVYNLSSKEQERKLKFVFIRLGIRIKNITKKDYLVPIGALAGITSVPENIPSYTGEGFSEEMLVMSGFPEKLLDEMLLRFRKEKIPKINLKAVVTPSNQAWNSLELYKEIKKEHEQMSSH